MPKPGQKPATKRDADSPAIDTQVIYCGDNLDKLRKLPAGCVDLIYIDPPFNSNRNYEVFWDETKEKRAFEDRHESTKAYIDYMRPRCVELARVLAPSLLVKGQPWLISGPRQQALGASLPGCSLTGVSNLARP
jgi:hypothetical protein